MYRDKDLKKKIRAVFEKPEKSFDEWAAENGIGLTSPVKPEKAQPSGVSARRPHVRVGAGAAAAVRRGALIAVPLLMIAAIIIPVLVANMSAPESPALYGYNDVISQRITVDEVKALPDICLFDMSGVVQTESVTKEMLKTDETFVLSYVLTNNLLSVANGETTDAFYVTYRIRLYEHYEFITCDNYDNLTRIAAVNGYTVAYDIFDSRHVTAYARFAAGGYEYFMEASGFDGITELTKDNFENLLNKILV